MDLWIGILAEDHLPGKSLGNTMFIMLKSQFEQLRDGDFYFYKYDPYLPLAVKFRVNRISFSELSGAIPN